MQRNVGFGHNRHELFGTGDVSIVDPDNTNSCADGGRKRNMEGIDSLTCIPYVNVNNGILLTPGVKLGLSL